MPSSMDERFLLVKLYFKNGESASETIRKFGTAMKIKSYKDLPSVSTVTSECHYHLEGYVNKQNWRHWGSQRPDFEAVRPLHPKSVTFWAGIHAGGIIGPYLFQKSVTGDRYHKLLEEEIIPRLEELNLIDDYWWMQDGAPPHRVGKVMDLLHDKFNNRVIALGFPERFDEGLQWPPYSPDINPMDFSVWGWTKDKVYKNKKHTLETLRDEIHDAFKEITSDKCAKIIQNFVKRIRILIASEGKIFENCIR